MPPYFKISYLNFVNCLFIGKSLFYNLSRWNKLIIYATNNFLNIDNNPVEKSIRPIAVSRKSYLFTGSHAATQRSAIFYSLLDTCKNYNINPVDWLHDVLTRIGDSPINKIKDLLPQNYLDNKNNNCKINLCCKIVGRVLMGGLHWSWI